MTIEELIALLLTADEKQTARIRAALGVSSAERTAELLDRQLDDFEDKINRRGRWDPDY